MTTVKSQFCPLGTKEKAQLCRDELIILSIASVEIQISDI